MITQEYAYKSIEKYQVHFRVVKIEKDKDIFGVNLPKEENDMNLFNYLKQF